MTFVTRWDPFREFTQLQRQMNRWMEDFGPQTSRGRDELMTSGTFVPAVDVWEDEHSIVLNVEVPGIKQDDIDIRLENHTLTIRGERKFENEVKEENFHRIERNYGAFSRSFTLPNTVDTEQVSADYENGVLKVRLAKRAEAKPKQIKVNVNGSGQRTLEGKGKAA